MRIAMQASLGRISNVILFVARRVRTTMQYFKDDPDRFVVCSIAVIGAVALVVI